MRKILASLAVLVAMLGVSAQAASASTTVKTGVLACPVAVRVTETVQITVLKPTSSTGHPTAVTLNPGTSAAYALQITRADVQYKTSGSTSVNNVYGTFAATATGVHGLPYGSVTTNRNFPLQVRALLHDKNGNLACTTAWVTL